MNKKNIFQKYKEVHIAPGGAIYINIKIIKKVVYELYKNNFKVTWYEFLRVTPKSTQPFMEYSIWKEGGYTEEEIYKELDILKEKLVKKDFKEEEIFFDIIVLGQDGE